MKQGTTVVATFGYNSITKKPFSFLYDFGYYNIGGACIVYKQGERNMQDAKCFELDEIREATEEDMNNLFWG